MFFIDGIILGGQFSLQNQLLIPPKLCPLNSVVSNVLYYHQNKHMATLMLKVIGISRRDGVDLILIADQHCSKGFARSFSLTRDSLWN